MMNFELKNDDSNANIKEAARTIQQIDLPYSLQSYSSTWYSELVPDERNAAHGTGSLLDPSAQGWSPLVADQSQWFQLSCGAGTTVSGVAIKGRSDYAQWVTGFRVSWLSSAGVWEFLQCKNAATGADGDCIYDSNVDQQTVVEVLFDYPVMTSALRIHPWTWEGTHISMRAGYIVASPSVVSCTPQQVLGKEFTSASALFGGPYERERDLAAEFGTIFGASGQQDCPPQSPGFNTMCADGNAARWGYCNNVPDQGCQSDGADSDGVIGFGLKGQDCCPMGAGHTSFFVSDTNLGSSAGNEMRKQAWILVRDCPEMEGTLFEREQLAEALADAERKYTRNPYDSLIYQGDS